MKNLSFCVGFVFLILLYSYSEADHKDSILKEPVYGKDFTVTGVRNDLDTRSEDFFIEVSGRIHRPRRGCDYGFGLCDWSISINTREDTQDYWHFTSNLSTTVNTRGTENFNYYFEVMLDFPLSEDFDSNFYIDDPLQSGDYSLVVGTYELDSSMGDFGGFRIPVSYN